MGVDVTRYHASVVRPVSCNVRYNVLDVATLLRVIHWIYNRPYDEWDRLVIYPHIADARISKLLYSYIRIRAY